MYEDQAQCQKAIDPAAEAMSFLQRYVKAKLEFDDACRAQQNASIRREKAFQELAALNNQVIELTQEILNDPTCPAPTNPCSGPNIGVGGQLGGLRQF